jgi:hypothetical protein
MKAAAFLFATALCSTQALALNLVTNGNFQIGSLAGWTLEDGNAEVATVGSNHYAVLGSSGADYAFQLTQLIATAPSSVPYTFFFDWGVAPSAVVQSMLVAVNTQAGVAFSVVVNSTPSSVPNFSRHVFEFTTTALPFQISFSNATSGARVSQMLDNVSVVPEPPSVLLLLAGASLILQRRLARRQASGR